MSSATNNIGPLWDDNEIWKDTLVWSEFPTLSKRKYESDDKITIMSDSKKAIITFKNSEEEPERGFELGNINVEALFYQRSQKI